MKIFLILCLIFTTNICFSEDTVSLFFNQVDAKLDEMPKKYDVEFMRKYIVKLNTDVSHLTYKVLTNSKKSDDDKVRDFAAIKTRHERVVNALFNKYEGQH
jgi:hypothetical protein